MGHFFERFMATPTPDDVGLMGKILGGLGAALSAVSLWAWNHTHKRIDEKVDKETYADRGNANNERFAHLTKEIEMQRGHVAKIFDNLSVLERNTNHQFSCLTKQIDEKYISLLNAIHGIDKK